MKKIFLLLPLLCLPLLANAQPMKAEKRWRVNLGLWVPAAPDNGEVDPGISFSGGYTFLLDKKYALEAEARGANFRGRNVGIRTDVTTISGLLNIYTPLADQTFFGFGLGVGYLQESALGINATSDTAGIAAIQIGAQVSPNALIAIRYQYSNFKGLRGWGFELGWRF